MITKLKIFNLMVINLVAELPMEWSKEADVVVTMQGSLVMILPLTKH